LKTSISRKALGDNPLLARTKSGKMPDFTGWKPVPPGASSAGKRSRSANLVHPLVEVARARMQLENVYFAQGLGR
jgi:hypothetical protein